MPTSTSQHDRPHRGTKTLKKRAAALAAARAAKRLERQLTVPMAYKVRAAEAEHLLKGLRTYIVHPKQRAVLDAALELVRDVPHAFSRDDAKRKLRTVAYLLPNIFGLRATRE